MEDNVFSEFSPYLTGYPKDNDYTLTLEEQQELKLKEPLFNQITAEFPVSLGKELSQRARKELEGLHRKDFALTYGEGEFATFGEIFATLRSRYGALGEGVFYDLGSGTGKAVVAAALLHSFRECRGIELLEPLFQKSLELKERYDALLPEGAPITFLRGDLLAQDISDASMVYIASTCFEQSMMRKIGQLRVRPGTFAITLTKHLPLDSWGILESVKKKMSWGVVTIYIQQSLIH